MKRVNDISLQHCPGVPFLLVGTQTDLRGVAGAGTGQRLASQLGAAAYVECSALTHFGLERVFRQALLAHLNRAPPEQSGCCSIT